MDYQLTALALRANKFFHMGFDFFADRHERRPVIMEIYFYQNLH